MILENDQDEILEDIGEEMVEQGARPPLSSDDEYECFAFTMGMDHFWNCLLHGRELGSLSSTTRSIFLSRLASILLLRRGRC